jgi:predicted PurR-regulated permease PerM
VSEQRITPSVLYRTVLLAFGLAVAGLIFKQIITLVLAVLIVVILAVPLSAFTSALQRIGIPRGIGAPLGLLLALGLFGGLIALIVPIFTREINQFTTSLPSIIDALRRRLGQLTGTSPSHIGKQAQHFVDTYTQHPAQLLGPLESVGASVVAAFTVVIVVLLTVLYTAIHPQPLADGLVRMAPPARRAQAAQILARLRAAYLGWLRGLAVGMIVLGGVTYVSLRIVGLGFAAFFAVFTAVAMIIPYFGALLSSIPPIVYALTISPGKALVVAGIYVIAHQLEGNVIQPLVVARTVKLHPAVVAIGVVAVDRLLGFVGLIVAVPILATIKILIDELWIKPQEERSSQLIVNPTGADHPAQREPGMPPQTDEGRRTVASTAT